MTIEEQLIILKNEIDGSPLLTGQGMDSKIMIMLNAEGSANVEAWVTSGMSKNVDKQAMLNLIPDAELVAFDTLLNSETTEAKAMKIRFDPAATINMADERVRSDIDLLAVAGIISSNTKAILKRLGEVKASRSQELFNAQITESDVTAARGL